MREIDTRYDFFSAVADAQYAEADPLCGGADVSTIPG
jgi:hypothetical protein